MKQWKAQKMIAREGYKIVNLAGEIENNVIALNIVSQDDAQLIASAPELFNACKRALEYIDYIKYEDVWKQLKQAISKAKEKECIG